MMAALATSLRILGIVLPFAIAGCLWLFVRRRRRVARAWGDPDLARRLVGEDLQRVPWPRALALLLAAILLGAALADSRWEVAGATAATEGGPVVLVLDVSNSMLVEDLRPSRMALQRQLAGELVRAVPGRPVGIVVFAGRAYALVPPTTDPAALDLFLDALDPNMVTQTGSSLAAAVRQAVGMLVSGGGEGGSVVLVTDGDTRESLEELRETLRVASRGGIPVHTVGAGTAAGGPVPDVDLATGRRLGVKREEDGSVAVSTLNQELLREVAETTGGAYFPLSELPTEQVAARLSRVGGGSDGEEQAPRFAWFAVPALLLLLAENAFVRKRRKGDG